MDHNYREYSVEELAQDSSFIRWVKQHPLANARFWENWLKDNPDKVALVEQAKALVLAIDFAPKEISDARVDALWEKIRVQQEAAGRSPKIRNLWPLAIAASLAILLMVRFLSPNTLLSVQTTTGERLVYTLPDDSRVTLNALSQIRFDPDTWSDNRSVELQGEAYFEVRKGSTFDVHTSEGTVRVLGTAFNVFAREGAFKVLCFEGKVGVTAKNDQGQTVLTPGMGVQLNGEQQLESYTTTTSAGGPSWQRGLFEFSNERLSNVFDELQRQFGVTIRADKDILDSPYTGFFEKGDLTLALQAICWPKQLNYSITDTWISIERDTTTDN